MSNKKDIFCVGDMYLGACLLSYGAELVRIDRDDPKRQQFFFSGLIPEVVVKKEEGVECLKNVSLAQVELLFVGKRIFLPPDYPDSVRSMKLAIHASND